MLAIQGYFDGVAIQPLERMIAKPNQRVIITIMDEFLEPEAPTDKRGMRGALAQFADPALAAREADAWERAVGDKHGNT